MATPKIIADFETQLATAISVGDTSFTLSSATDDDGVALPAGLYYFTLDNGNSNKEFIAGTLSGTSVTGALTVSRQGAETSGAARAHRVGTPVIISDWATYKKYMDEIALVSAPDADTSTKGVMEAATLAEVRAGTASGSTGANLAVTPDVLDDLPTQDEKAGMAAGGDFGTVSTSNKYLTEDYIGIPLTSFSDQVTFTSSGTWTKDSGLVRVRVQAWGGGGGGWNISNEGAGGGGGYSEGWFEAADLGATETITVGAGGSTGGGDGGNTTFGSLLTAAGGSGGQTSVGGAGGGVGNIDVSPLAGAGGSTANGSPGLGGGGGGDGASGSGGDGYYGGGGGGTGSGSGGASTFGGAGGADSVAGTQPGGGGGRAAAGADGQVIVTEYYS